MPGQFQGERRDPYQGYKFTVVSNGLTVGGFTMVEGLEHDVEVVEYREGTDPVTARKLPGLSNFPDITLKRGLSINNDFELMMQRITRISQSGNLGPDGAKNPDFRVTFSIRVHDVKSGEVVKTYDVFNAFSRNYKPGDFEASNSEVIIEEIVFANEGWEQTVGAGS